MSTHTQILYQIVFCTKYREQTLTKENRIELYKFFWGILNNKKCFVYRIGGVEDHVHLIIDLHPSISLASLVKDIKVSSSKFIKEKHLFENFRSWQPGYGAFTYSIESKNTLIEYVKNQENHHSSKKSKIEYIELLQAHEVEYDGNFVE